MIFINFIVATICLAYHFICHIFESNTIFIPELSLSLSAAMCFSGILFGDGLTKDFLSPPRVLAVLYLIFYPIFAVFYLLFPELGKWYHLYYPLLKFNEHIAWSVFYVTITLPIFQVGFYWRAKKLWSRPIPPIPTVNTLPSNRINKTMIIATCVGVVGMFLYANSLGGIDHIKQMMGNIIERKSWRGQGSLGYYPGMLLMIAPAVSLLTALYARFSWKLLTIGLCLLSIAIPVLVTTQASREKALFPILLIILCTYYYRKRQGKKLRITRKTIFTAILCTILVGVFMVHSTYRHQQIKGSHPYYFRLASDFNRIDISVVMYFHFLQCGQSNLYGKPFLSYIIQPFTRFFEINPIPNTSELLGKSIFPSDRHGNPGAPLAGELFVNFGALGYIVFLVAGSLFAKAHSSVFKSQFEFWTTISYSTWLYLFTFKFCIQHGISESLLFAVIVLTSIWCLRWLSSGPRLRW